MPRQLYWRPTVIAGASVTPAKVAQPVASQVEKAGFNIINAALDAGQEVLGIMGKDYNRFQTCRVSDLVEQTNRRFEEWKADWTKNNQGVNATDAQKLADRISTEPGSDPGLVIDNFQQIFGRHAPQIMQEIMPRAGNMANIICNMKRIFASERKALFQAAKDQNYEKATGEMLGLSGIVKTQFEQLVMEELKDFNLTLGAVGNSGIAYDICRGVNMLARHYLMTGLENDHGKAIHRAAQAIVLGSYELLPNRNMELPYRVPKNLPAQEIGKGAENWLHDANLDGCHVELRPDMAVSKQNEGLASVIRNQAYWVTNENESGLTLMLAGRRICGKDGKPVNVTWEQFHAMRETESSRRQAEMRKFARGER